MSLGGLLSRVDTIVAKLERAKASESERQFRDVRAILSVAGDGLDREYIERWTEELSLAELWARVNRDHS